MRKHFPAYYRLRSEDLKTLWAEGIFIVDTNVLLGLYRYPKQAQDDLLAALRRLGNRLWIPHQVALEFQENRLDVIYEQFARYGEVKDLLQETRADLQKKLDQMQLKERHSRINPEPLLVKLDEAFATFRSELDTLQQQHDLREVDPTREAIDNLLDGHVGDPLTQSELDELYKEGAKRYEQRRPPGYLDIGKEKEKNPCYFYNDLTIKRQYGDLIAWFQVIKEAKSRSAKAVVLVTEDRTEDWWWVQKRHTIGPRPELVAEIVRRASVSLFHMYRVDRFLHYTREYLGTDVKEDSVAQVRDIALTDAPPRSYADYERSAYNAVLDWIRTSHPNGTVSYSPSFPDFVVGDGTRQIGYDVKTARRLSALLVRKWVESAETRLKLPSSAYLSSVSYVVVCESREEAFKASRVVQALRLANTAIGIVIGYLGDVAGATRRFIPLGSGDDQEQLPRDPSWLCPNCRSWGPWDGARCLNCGRMSDPND